MTEPNLPSPPTPAPTAPSAPALAVRPDPWRDPAAPTLAEPVPFAVPVLPPPPPAAPAAPARGAPTRSRGASTWISIGLAPILAVSLFVGGAAADRSGLLGGPGPAPGTEAPSGSAADLALVEEAWQDLHQYYVDAKGLDDQALAYAAIEGMTTAIGDVGHTTFLTADQAKAFTQSLSGSFVGVGVTMGTTDTGGFVVNSVIPGTPAEAAGLKRGDKIIAVDGKPTAGETSDQVVSAIRGPEGQTVTLTIERAGVANFDVSIVRRKLEVPTVAWAMVPGRTVALIRLDQFNSGATKAMQDAITKARAAGATAIIFDLRGNGGGYASEAVGVASQFLADGTVYKSIDASGTEKDVPVEPGGLATDIPLVVLADGATASAAEIVTGAIQDAGRAQVVGEKTFGTGTVTQSFSLADGSSLRIGVERWLTRAGRPIWHEGLQPDVTVPLAANAQLLLPGDLTGMTAAQLAASSDAQLLKALDLLTGRG
jgi:carboxyl-terminal processing protease